MNREIKLLAALVLAWAVSASTARGQADLAALLDPKLGKAKPKVRYAVAGYPSRSVRHQRAEFGYASHDLAFSLPIRQSDEYEWSLSGKLGAIDVNTGAMLPGFAETFPEDLWDIGLAVGHRRRLDDDWQVGISAEIGSASDAPFASAGETTFTSTGFLRIPAEDDDAWFVMLMFRTECDALRGAPLVPGVAYHWVKDDTFQALLGVPLAWAQYKPVKPLKLSAMAMPTKARAKCSYSLGEKVDLYAGYDWNGRRFVRRDRTHGNERLFFYGQSVSAGVRWDMNEHMWLDVGGGYAFDRFVFEGKRYHNRHTRRFRIGDTPFAALRIGWSY